MQLVTELDDIDSQIVVLLRENARRTNRDIARRIGLTAAPVKRRIERLERSGVIEGYTVRIGTRALGPGLEAVVQLRVEGNMDLGTILRFTSDIPEVSEVLTLAGDPDAVIRVRAENIEELQRVVNRIRTASQVTGTRTLVVLGTWSRGD